MAQDTAPKETVEKAPKAAEARTETKQHEEAHNTAGQAIADEVFGKKAGDDKSESNLEKQPDAASVAQAELGKEAAEGAEDLTKLEHEKREGSRAEVDPKTGEVRDDAYKQAELKEDPLRGAHGREDLRTEAEAKNYGIELGYAEPAKALNKIRDNTESLDTTGKATPGENVETPRDRAVEPGKDVAPEVKEGEADKGGEPQTLEEATKRLKELTDGQMGDKNQASFDANLEKFLENPELSDKMKMDTLNNLRKTLEAGDKSAKEGIGVEGGIQHDYLGTGKELSDNVRTVVAGAMDNAANPHSIDQGDSRQCNATTVAEQLYTQNPALATQKLNDVVTKAELTGTRSFDENGKAINDGGEFTGKVPPGIFKAAISESGNLDQSGNEVHNVADRLLKGGIINQTKQQYGQWFTELQGVPGTGERLYQMNSDGSFSDRNVRDGNGKIVQGPGADIHDVAGMAKGAGVENVAIMVGKGYYDSSRGSMDNLTVVSSAQDIQNAMKGKAGGILGGNSGDRFFTGRDDLSGGGHVVSLFNGQDGKFNVSDQYGSQRDRNGVSAEVLANITKSAAERQAQGSPRARNAEEYGRRADGGSTRPGFNPETDRSHSPHSQSDGQGGSRNSFGPHYEPGTEPGIRDNSQKLEPDNPHDKAEENPEKPEELKKAQGEAETGGQRAAIQTRIDALQAKLATQQAQLDKAESIDGLVQNLAGEIAALRAQQNALA